MEHTCIACIADKPARVIMHKKNGEATVREDGSPYKYCAGHWDFMLTYSPKGTVFEIEKVD